MHWKTLLQILILFFGIIKSSCFLAPYSEILNNIPFSSHVIICLDHPVFSSDGVSKAGQAVLALITLCQEEIKSIVKKLNGQQTLGTPSIVLDHSLESTSFTVLKELASFYLDETKMNKRLNVFLFSNSNSTLASLRSTFTSIPMQMTLIVLQQEANSITSAWEITIINSHLITQPLSLVELHRVLSFGEVRKYKIGLFGTKVKALAINSTDELYGAQFKTQDGNVSFMDEGYAVSLLKDMQETLNFTIVAVPGSEYISECNNSVCGMGAQLLNEEADVIITMSYAVEFRVKYLSPTTSFINDKIMIYFRQPTRYSERNIFLHPFDNVVWIVILLSLLLIFISVVAIVKVEILLKLRNPGDASYEWIFRALVQKSSVEVFERLPEKVSFFTTIVTFWIIYSFYSASIISRLSVSSNPITSVLGLLNAKFRLLADPLFEYAKFLQITSTSYNEAISYTSDVDSVSKVFQGGHAFITSYDLVIIASRNLGIERSVCGSLSALPLTPNGLRMPLHWYTRKGYPYKELINRELLKSMEKGLNFKYKAEYLWHTTPPCPKVSRVVLKDLALSDVYSCFIGLFVLYLWGILTFFGEKARHRRKS